MGQGVNGEVFPYWRRGDPLVPIEGKVNGGEAYRKVPGRVLGPKRGEGRERLWESGRGRVGFWGGTGDSVGGKAPFVSTIGSNRGEVGLPGYEGGRGGEEVVGRRYPDSVSEAVHAPEHSVVSCEEVGPIGEYGEVKATGKAMAEEGPDDSSWREEVLDDGEDGLGQREAVSVVVGSVEGVGDRVS